MLWEWVGGQQNITIAKFFKVRYLVKWLQKHNHRWVGGQKTAKNA